MQSPSCENCTIRRIPGASTRRLGHAHSVRFANRREGGELKLFHFTTPLLWREVVQWDVGTYDPVRLVDDFVYPQVGRDAAENVGLLPSQMVLPREVVYHVPHGDLGRLP